MKKWMKFTVLTLVFVFLGTLSFAARERAYGVGEFEGGLLTDEKLKDAIQSAVDKFEGWMYEGVPSGYVTKTDDYYLQPYADGEDRTAAVYVGPDYRAYVLRGPIYEQLETVGGWNTLGRPLSDAYEKDGVWYQNFERGYVTAGETGKARFVAGQKVDDKGVAFSTDGSDAGTSSTGTGSATDRPQDSTDGSMQSPSEMISDVVSDVTDMAEEVSSHWGAWVFVILLILAIVVLAVYWFLKRK